MKIETCSIFMNAKWKITFRYIVFWFKYHLKHLFDISAYIWRSLYMCFTKLFRNVLCCIIVICTNSSNVAYLYWQCIHIENKNVVLNEIQHFVIQKDSYLCTSQNVPFEMRKVFQEFLECFVQEIDRWLPFL